MKSEWGLLAAACALVIGVYAYIAHSGFVTTTSPNVADDLYNLLVQGFRAGQLSLKKEVPSGFAQLADPYDPAAHAPYPVFDLTYYKGKFYLYFGVTPAVLLFWPYAVVTGHYLSQKDAGVVFSVVGFLASVGLLCALWRRYFAKVSIGVVVAGALALGLATFTPLLLAQCDVYEVTILCGYALTMLALAAMWQALHEPERRAQWLAAASAAYGLAVGARPSLLFGAVILLVPVARAWRERRKFWSLVIAATGPITLIGLGLMLYNALRFDNPFDFGEHYQLAGSRQVTQQFFSLHYLWFNFRVYFLEPARWSCRSPFVQEGPVPPWPVGYEQVRSPFGILTNIPLVWAALAVPLAWRNRSEPAGSALRWFVTAAALLFGLGALTVSLYWSSSFRYEMDFLPALVLLAVIGVLSLERALAGQPVRRRVARCGCGLMLGFSVAFSLLASVKYCAQAHTFRGDRLRVAGRHQEAIEEYERALQIVPDDARAHNSLGYELLQAGQVAEAIGHFQQSLRIRPDGSEAHNNLGSAFERLGRMPEAKEQYEQALQIDPDNSSAHNNLANTLVQNGELEDAIKHYEEALRLNPDFAEAHCNLGITLARAGRTLEAVGQLEQALRLKPGFPEAQKALDQLRARQSTP